MLALDEPNDLREALHRSRAEAESLRLDLSEALGFVEALEAELWASSGRRRAPGWPNTVREPSSLNLLLHARTLIRRTLFQELVPGGDRNAALHDLRIAEVAFRFLLGLRSLPAE